MLNILDGFDLAALGHNQPATLHLLAETMRRAYADRFAYLADPDFAAVPIAGLTSPAFAAARRATIDAQRTDLNPSPGDPWAYEAARGAATPPAAALPDASCTTHLCTADRNRMLVSLTNTLGELWGRRVVVPGSGVLLNDGMVWFDPRPGTLNSITPRRRSLSNMTPMVLLRDGKPFLAIGAPGGRKLMTGILQGILNVVDFGLGVADAVGVEVGVGLGVAVGGAAFWPRVGRIAGPPVGVGNDAGASGSAGCTAGGSGCVGSSAGTSVAVGACGAAPWRVPPVSHAKRSSLGRLCSRRGRRSRWRSRR